MQSDDISEDFRDKLSEDMVKFQSELMKMLGLYQSSMSHYTDLLQKTLLTFDVHVNSTELFQLLQNAKSEMYTKVKKTITFFYASLIH